MTNEKLNIFQKIVEIKKDIAVFVKDTVGYKYKYVSGSQILSKIKHKMDELGVILQPSIKVTKPCAKEIYHNDRNQEKTGYIIEGEMEYTWINANNPDDRFTIPWYFVGMQDDPSKAFGSALTYTERYFLLKSFGIPTDELGPDAHQEPDEDADVKNSATCPECGKGKKPGFMLCYTCGQGKKYGVEKNTPNNKPGEVHLTQPEICNLIREYLKEPGYKSDIAKSQIDKSKKFNKTQKIDDLILTQAEWLLNEIENKIKMYEKDNYNNTGDRTV